ncbi:hypothetical protein [Conexibacter sp. CPCC 206217]|uniref:hypothetical protein n=1 Tax=Conexibacter sp. CPCC 206217 TaxID=3064574 RepID=UPI002724082F|nr:hypothetical protein [Conexibacter sp. CPCC 206217]MDO8209751.1 hypothetical protein [Conexibacter sp. CPCC 206217]
MTSTIDDVPPPEVVADSLEPLIASVSESSPHFDAVVGRVTVKGYLAQDTSPNDPYVIADSSAGSSIVVVVNMKHPHIRQVVGSEGFLNYLRYSVYDAIAEWQARQRQQTPDPDTMKMLKDKLLRIAMLIEMHTPDPTGG